MDELLNPNIDGAKFSFKNESAKQTRMRHLTNNHHSHRSDSCLPYHPSQQSSFDRVSLTFPWAGWRVLQVLSVTDNLSTLSNLSTQLSTIVTIQPQMRAFSRAGEVTEALINQLILSKSLIH